MTTILRCALLAPLAAAALAGDAAIEPQGREAVFEAAGRMHVRWPGGGDASLRDEHGRELARLAVPADGALDVPLPGPGFYRLTAGAATAAALVLAPPPANAMGSRPFGMFSVRTDDPLAARAGGRWNRVFVDIGAIRPQGDGFAWGYEAKPDSGYMAGAALGRLAADQRWIVCLAHPPEWLAGPAPGQAREKHKDYPPRDWERFAAMIRWVTAQLPPHADHLEVINEPEPNWRGSEAELARYHTVVADAAHAVRADLRVIGPSLCNVDLPRLDRLAALGLFDRLDGLAIHPYVNGSAPEGEFMTRVDALLAWNAARPRPLPVYLTEFGWQTGNPAGEWQRPVDELTQARYQARAQILLATRPGIAAQLSFCLFFRTAAGHFDHYSLLGPEGGPRPAYAYVATAMRRLGGTGPGAWLRLGAGAQAAVFPRPGSAALVLWSAEGEQEVILPFLPRALIGAAGRILARPEDDRLRLGPDPMHLDVDPAIATAPVLPALLVRCGAAADLPAAAVLAPTALVEGRPGAWRVRADAPRGDWEILVRGEAGWGRLPVRVAAPVAASGAVAWVGRRPVWRVALASTVDQPVEVDAALAVSGSATRAASVGLAPGGGAAIDLPLDRLPWGRRLGGSLALSTAWPGAQWRDTLPFRATLAAAEAAEPGRAPDWERIPAMEFSAWAPFTGAGVPAAAEPGDGARLRLAHAADGLHLLVEVADARHVQGRPVRELWREDSLQIGIDVDADQPWQANAGRFWNGHRVAEYGVALGADGPVAWRFLAANGLAADQAEPRLAAAITHDGAAAITRYRLFLPWGILGLEQTPAAGSGIGLALVVNQVDAPGGERRGLRLFYGIAERKDPAAYGRCVLLPPP